MWVSSLFGLWGNNVNRERLQSVKIDMSFRGSSHVFPPLPTQFYVIFFHLGSKVYLIPLAGLVKTFKTEFRVIQLNRLSYSVWHWLCTVRAMRTVNLP